MAGRAVLVDDALELPLRPSAASSGSTHSGKAAEISVERREASLEAWKVMICQCPSRNTGVGRPVAPLKKRTLDPRDVVCSWPPTSPGRCARVAEKGEGLRRKQRSRSLLLSASRRFGRLPRPTWGSAHSAPSSAARRRQDSGDAEQVSSGHADRSARHSWHGITLEAVSHHDPGIGRLVELDHHDDNLPTIRQMPGGSELLSSASKLVGVPAGPVASKRCSCRFAPSGPPGSARPSLGRLVQQTRKPPR
jgi:hypothetical protein